VITVGGLALLVAFSKESKLDVSTVDINAIQTASEQNGNIADHVFGKTDSKVTLINYGDFQCPHCSQIHPIVKEITEEYKNQIRFVFRNFSISSFPNSRAASATVEAAGLQGKYWEMHNKIYELQSDWSNSNATDRTEIFIGYATELELDIDKFKVDLASTNISKKINYDFSLGKKAGVEGTPTFYLNGSNLDLKIVSDETKFREAINSELKKFNIALPESAK